MNQVIEQFELKGKGEQLVQMPLGASVTNLAAHDGAVYLWAFCDPKAIKINRKFFVVTNAEALPDEPHHYVGTFYLPALSGPHFTRKAYVGHVFTDRKEYPL